MIFHSYVSLPEGNINLNQSLFNLPKPATDLLYLPRAQAGIEGIICVGFLHPLHWVEKHPKMSMASKSTCLKLEGKLGLKNEVRSGLESKKLGPLNFRWWCLENNISFFCFSNFVASVVAPTTSCTVSPSPTKRPRKTVQELLKLPGILSWRVTHACDDRFFLGSGLFFVLGWMG